MIVNCMVWQREKNLNTREREYWVDYVKLFACVLVVFFHFYAGLVRASIVRESKLYLWLISTVYMFHVPLFFITSGYLYQKNNAFWNIHKHLQNVVQKVVTLLIPYTLFTIICWWLNQIASRSVNNQIKSDLLTVLFLKPILQYWFIYCLFFLFLFIPVLKTKVHAVIILMLTLVIKFSDILLPIHTYIHWDFLMYYNMLAGLCLVC
jgi:fucose 4-O-acetylase-like acetyltransferase